MITPLTKEQAIILTGFTGILCCKHFSDFHEDIDKRLGEEKLGRPIMTHDFAEKDVWDQIRELYREDFFKLIEGQ